MTAQVRLLPSFSLSRVPQVSLLLRDQGAATTLPAGSGKFEPQTGGVASLAHVGGLIFGAITARWFEAPGAALQEAD